MIQNVEIIKAEQRTDLGRGDDMEGLRLTVKAAGNVWQSCIELSPETALLVLQGFNVMAAPDLEGKWCIVDVAKSGIVSYVGPISRNILLSTKQKTILMQMESEVLYSAYELDAPLESMDMLCSLGLLRKQIVKSGPLTFIQYEKSGDL